MKKNPQYAALPYALRDGALMLMLITSRQTGRWIIPKGWPIKGLQPHEVACREAFEEAGLVGRINQRSIASFKYTKRLEGNRRRRCSVEVFPLSVQQVLEEWPEKGQRQREWVSPAQAALRVSEVGLIELLQRLSQLPPGDDPFPPEIGGPEAG